MSIPLRIDIREGLNRPDDFIQNDGSIYIEQDFVISRNNDGTVLSKYSDDNWDFSPYKSNIRQNHMLNFEYIDNENRDIVKELMFYRLVVGGGTNGSLLSVATIVNIFLSCLRPLANFSNKLNVNIITVLENDKFIQKYIKEECIDTARTYTFRSLLEVLNRTSNEKLGIKYRHNENIIKQLIFLYAKQATKYKQHPVIPSRIYSEYITVSWKIVNTALKHQKSISNLIEYRLIHFTEETKKYSTRYKMNLFWKKWKKLIGESSIKILCNELNLEYSSDFKWFVSFLSSIQKTCLDLIGIYTGMRIGEALTLNSDCYKTRTFDGSKVSYLEGMTHKYQGRNVSVKWVTTSEIEKAIKLLNVINTAVSKYLKCDLSECRLILSTVILEKIDQKPKTIDELNKKKTSLAKNNKLLPLYNNCEIKEQDLLELEEIEFNHDWRNDSKYQIGLIWPLTHHQFRRSLAVYALRSGKVSIGALQGQLKHLLREVTLYYGKGSLRAKLLFGEDPLSNKHISKYMEDILPEIDTINLLSTTVFSDEKLFGAHGVHVERNIIPNIQSGEITIVEFRKQTIKNMKNGSIAFKSTPLGGCVSIEKCDKRMLRQVTACIACTGSVIVESKLNRVIQLQEKFINELEKDSIEYRTEHKELIKLKDAKNKLIKGDTNE